MGPLDNGRYVLSQPFLGIAEQDPDNDCGDQGRNQRKHNSHRATEKRRGGSGRFVSELPVRVDKIPLVRRAIATTAADDVAG